MYYIRLKSKCNIKIIIRYHSLGSFAEGQYFAMEQLLQSGFLALQIFRPWKIIRWLNIVHPPSRFFGTISIRSYSSLTGSEFADNPSRRLKRMTCVSQVIPGIPKTLPSRQFAVFLPTPGSLTSSCIVEGTSLS